MALRVSEKEAIERGWIPAPPAPPAPPPTPARQYRGGGYRMRRLPGKLSTALLMIAAWLLGFAMATLFPR